MKIFLMCLASECSRDGKQTDIRPTVDKKVIRNSFQNGVIF